MRPCGCSTDERFPDTPPGLHSKAQNDTCKCRKNVLGSPSVHLLQAHRFSHTGDGRRSRSHLPVRDARVGARTFLLTSRLDLITAEQYARVRAVLDEQWPLSVVQVRALFRVPVGKPGETGSAAVRELQEAGLLAD